MLLQVLGTCCEVLTTRYILYIKERLQKAQKFTEEQIALIKRDMVQLCKYFEGLKDSCIHTSVQDPFLEPPSKGAGSAKGSAGAVTDLSYPVEELLSRYNKALTLLTEIPQLMDASLPDSKLVSICTAIRQRYDYYSAMSGGHTNVGYSYVSAIVFASRSLVGDTTPASTLSKLQDKIKNALDHAPIMSLYINTSEKSDFSGCLKEDSVTRVFGNKPLTSSGHSHLRTSNGEDKPSSTGVLKSIADSDSVSDVDNNDGSSTLSQSNRPFSTLRSLAPSSPFTKGTRIAAAMNIKSLKSEGSSMLSATSTVLNATTHALTSNPNKAMKKIRETAADFNMNQVMYGLNMIANRHSYQKKIDEQAVETLRILGLLDERHMADQDVDDNASAYDSDNQSE